MSEKIDVKTLKAEEKKLRKTCIRRGMQYSNTYIDEFLMLCKSTIKSARKRKDNELFNIARNFLHQWSIKKSYTTGNIEYKEPKPM